MDLPQTYFDKWLGRSRPLTTIAIAGLVLYGIAFLIGYLTYGLPDLFREGVWRAIFRAPTIILYILLVGPRLNQLEAQVLAAISPLTALAEHELVILIQERATDKPHYEWASMGTGLLAGSLVVIVDGNLSWSWLSVYLLVSTAVMGGLLAWIIYVSVLSVDYIAVLLKLPLHINLFNLSPFVTVGRQSLYLALAFAGGIAISLFFVAIDLTFGQRLEFWLIYVPLLLMPVAIFFFNMYPTHQLIAAAKDEELGKVRRHIPDLSSQLLNQFARNEKDDTLNTTVTAVLTYEQRLQQISTWPYDIGMLRTLLFSIFLPLTALFL